MEELQAKLKILEEFALKTTDIDKNFSNIEQLIKEIQNEQNRILQKIEETKNIELNNKYQQWLKENEEYLFWLIKIGIKIHETSNLTINQKDNIKNLIHILTKYHAIYNKINDNNTSDKIKKQIENLYNDTFNNNFEIYAKDLIVPSIDDNLKKIAQIKEVPKKEITLKSLKAYFKDEKPKIEKEIKEPIKKHIKTEYSLKDNFYINLQTKLYENEYVTSPISGIIYPPNIKRQIKALGIKNKDTVKRALLKSEVEKYLQDGGVIISVLSTLNNIEEGWFKIEDIKKLEET